MEPYGTILIQKWFGSPWRPVRPYRVDFQVQVDGIVLPWKRLEIHGQFMQSISDEMTFSQSNSYYLQDGNKNWNPMYCVPQWFYPFFVSGSRFHWPTLDGNTFFLLGGALNIHHRNLGETSHRNQATPWPWQQRFPEVWILLHRSVTGGLHRHCGASNYWEDTPVAWAWDTRWSTPVTILFNPMFWQMGQQKSLIT